MHESLSIPFWDQYTLTVEEAAQYFRIGENKLRRIIAENPDDKFLLKNGGRTLIKRKPFEQFIDCHSANYLEALSANYFTSISPPDCSMVTPWGTVPAD